MGLYEDIDFIKVEDGRAVPGANWAKFTEGFDRGQADLKSLGHVAGLMVLEPMIVRDRFSMARAVRQLGAAARPPIKDPLFTMAANMAVLEGLQAKEATGAVAGGSL